ncbi:hypothetical protein G4H71_15370 [Rhodococcus triatomae]|uniref:hypothetical protein n=1 Tax=Rhodococcus triatomae TaxID=300028 RepID=UPI001629CCC3|nr:hypothetical protein [Rhodococcus triatomae]QNG24229.1 hypothetical protein G4H71_15370 [Rhodococcus triatomae]
MSAMSGSRPARHAVQAIAVVATILLGATACTNDTEPPAEPNPPELVHSHAWSTEPGTDLFSREAELVRASIEGAEMTLLFGIDNSFPGYSEAVGGPRETTDDRFHRSARWKYPVDVAPIPVTFFRHLVDLEVVDNRITASVCGYRLFADREDRMFNPLSEAIHVELDLPSGGNYGAAGPPDGDPATSDPDAQNPPGWNVFGDWRIQTLRLIPVSPDHTIPESCLPWWSSRFPEFERRTELNILNAPDGWAPPTQPVALQYPEWIGPTENQ